ncbi:hypothetical protein AAY473_007772 [Plecturocebus cupreus]
MPCVLASLYRMLPVHMCLSRGHVALPTYEYASAISACPAEKLRVCKVYILGVWTVMYDHNSASSVCRIWDTEDKSSGLSKIRRIRRLSPRKPGVQKAKVKVLVIG